jgi:methionyl-tRNA synthetase
MRKILVTSALPYANGELHLGHMVEHIQTDIWVRAQSLFGHHCISVCGEDAHGAPVMLKAQSLGISPQEMIGKMKERHDSDLKAFLVEYDHYYTTHSDENRALSSLIYERLKDRGDITTKVVKQAFDEEKGMFLPDRFIRGQCPRCDADDQYGDSCEVCGATYMPTELKNARSVLSGNPPIEKESLHFFFDLPRYEDMLKTFTKSDKLQPEVTNKLAEWFEAGLRMWDISRDAPYFGFEIPGEKDKYFYVWLDAPIGYMASFMKYCESHPEVSFDEFWKSDTTTDLYHFIGKDILYFHTLFWPAMLEGAGFRKPTGIFVHGFLTIDGQKMSKSRGTFIQAKDYLDHLNPEYLRYYFSCKLNSKVEDLDLSFDDFQARINADLVGKIINIASRSAGFINKRFDGVLSAELDNQALLETAQALGDEVALGYTEREYSRVVKLITGLADKINQYIDLKKPWQAIKDPALFEETHRVLSTNLNLFRLLVLYLKPILPNMVQNAETFLAISPLTWQDKDTLLTSHKIDVFKPLMQRVEQKDIDALLKVGQATS